MEFWPERGPRETHSLIVTYTCSVTLLRALSLVLQKSHYVNLKKLSLIYSLCGDVTVRLQTFMVFALQFKTVPAFISPCNHKIVVFLRVVSRCLVLGYSSNSFGSFVSPKS